MHCVTLYITHLLPLLIRGILKWRKKLWAKYFKGSSSKVPVNLQTSCTFVHFLTSEIQNQNFQIITILIFFLGFQFSGFTTVLAGRGRVHHCIQLQRTGASSQLQRAGHGGRSGVHCGSQPTSHQKHRGNRPR